MSNIHTTAISIEGISPEIENEIHEAISDLQDAQVDCTFVYRQPQPQAFFEWLMPTALLLWLADKYFGTLIEQAAEDHYPKIKSALHKIYDKALGKEPTITRVIQQAGGAVRHDKVFSGSLSIGYRSQDGWRVRLLFPLESSFQQYEDACLKFTSLVQQHLADPHTSVLNAEIEAEAEEKIIGLPTEITAAHVRNTVNLLIFWDQTSEKFMVADPVASSRTGTLVTWPLGARV